MNRTRLYRMRSAVALMALGMLTGCGTMPPADFAGSNIPRNPTTRSCQTTYFDPEVQFGFDLPPNAELIEMTRNDGSVLLNSLWHFEFDGQALALIVLVGLDPGIPLADFVVGRVGFVEGSPFRLADGTDAYLSVGRLLGGIDYRVTVIANGYLYELWGVVVFAPPSDAVRLFLLATVESLCID